MLRRHRCHDSTSSVPIFSHTRHMMYWLAVCLMNSRHLGIVSEVLDYRRPLACRWRPNLRLRRRRGIPYWMLSHPTKSICNPGSCMWVPVHMSRESVNIWGRILRDSTLQLRTRHILIRLSQLRADRGRRRQPTRAAGLICRTLFPRSALSSSACLGMDSCGGTHSQCN